MAEPNQARRLRRPLLHRGAASTAAGALALVIGLLATAAPADHAEAQAAKRVQIGAFFGKFAGKGITKSNAAQYYGLRNRDLNVDIADAGGGGFRLTWTTIRRRKAGDKKASTTMTFRPVEPAAGRAQARLWRAAGNGDILTGKAMALARIRGRALLVYVMGIRRRTGRLHLSIYSRRLAPAGLFLQFRRIEEGRPVRLVEALLKRTK